MKMEIRKMKMKIKMEIRKGMLVVVKKEQNKYVKRIIKLHIFIKKYKNLNIYFWG